MPQIDLTALEPVEEALCELSPAEAELLTAVLEDLAERREAVAAATPGPERVFPTDGYSARAAHVAAGRLRRGRSR